MKANTAVGLVLAGGALCVFGRPASPTLERVARAMALIVTALGLVTFGQYVFGWRLGIDELLFRDTANAYNVIPGRMSPYSALTFGAIGVALAVLPSARLRPLVWLMSALVVVVGVVSMLGYVWNASELVTDSVLPPVAVHTALAFTLLGIGILLASHRRHARPGAAAPTRASIEFKVASGFVGAFLLLVVGGGITYHHSAEFARWAQRGAHGQSVRAQLGQAQAAVSDAETAALDYVMTGVPRHKDDFSRFASESRRHTQSLARLVADDPSQQALLGRLNALATQQLESLQQLIVVRDDKGFEAARAAVETGEASSIMDSLRALTHEMDNAEAELLVQHELRASGGRQNALLFLLLTLISTAGIFVFLLTSIRREMLARAAADESIRRLNADLERRVEERTEELLQSTELYRYTLDNMLEGCQVIGFDWRYRYVNAAAARQHRQAKGALIGRTMMEAYPGLAATGTFATLRRCMEERISHRSEDELVFPDGRRGWFQVSVLPAPEGISIFSVDITERKRAEDQVRAVNADLERRVAERTTELVQAREAADAANRAKSAFLATMSHEIRTPMNGVIGMIEVLSHSRLEEHQADAVRTIRASAFSLLDIIDDILDFSKIEAGRLELERSPVALPHLIESVCETLSPLALDKDVELSLFVAPQVPAQMWSDATRLRQVLINLAGNAIKFSSGRSEQRGRVSIRADIAAGAPPRLVLRVADNGIGMAPETLDHVFSSFTQAEVSTTRRFGGTGLGLAICKRLVTLMHGEIHVQSTPNEGSTLTVTLPIEVVDGTTTRAYADLTGLDCIVVGSSANSDDLRVYLDHAGARVHLVANLDAAVRQASGLTRPVVIQDARRGMPSPDALHAAFAAIPEVRHVLIARGPRRRGPRATGPDVVTLDGNCLRRSALLRAVAVAAGRASPEAFHDGDGDDIVAGQQTGAPTIAEARAQGRLILIAEDDEVNQKVILRQIEMLGFAAEIADNGAEALRLWRAGHYALLLTDLHMPDMDGYALAEAIRREEAQRGPAWQERMPILALTANALRGEALRARGAGMDEYLTKPLPLHLLRAALMKWLPGDGGDTMSPKLHEESRDAQTSTALDLAVLKGMVGDDPQIVRDFLVDYRASVERLATELRAAYAADDIRQIGALAHKLKSSSRSVGALALGDLCSELENSCRTATRDGISRGMMQLEAALLAVDARIGHLLALS